MGETSIEWTRNADGSRGRSWNPTRGCTRISPGCGGGMGNPGAGGCYAETFAERWRGVPNHPYERGFDPRLVPEKLGEPLTWRKPTRVFVNSMSDLFHEAFPFEYIAAAHGVMAACPRHTFLLLTKREKRAEEFYAWLKERAAAGTMEVCLCAALASQWLDRSSTEFMPQLIAEWPAWPLPNVLFGVSVENRKHGLPRIDVLRRIPAALRWLSIEPQLEDVGEIDLTGIGFVVQGGESGQRARPYHFEWARSVQRQCRAAGVPYFHKQVGANPHGEWGDDNAPTVTVESLGGGLVPVTQLARHKNGRWKLRDRKGGSMSEWPADLRVREFPTTEPR